MQVGLEEALRERERDKERDREKTEEQKGTKNDKPTTETTGNRPNVQRKHKVSSCRQKISTNISKKPVYTIYICIRYIIQTRHMNGQPASIT